MFLTRRRIAMLTAEFLGTALLTSIVLTLVQLQGTPTYFVALASGFAIAALWLTVGATSGGHFNPAVSLALWSVRRSSALRTTTYVGAQVLGASVAYWAFTYFANTTLTRSGQFNGRILLAETLGALVLAIGYGAVVFGNYKIGTKAATVGASLVAGIMVASAASVGLLNPAIALGAGFWVWGTYILGPILGAVIGMNIYTLLFASEKEIVKVKD